MIRPRSRVAPRWLAGVAYAGLCAALLVPPNAAAQARAPTQPARAAPVAQPPLKPVRVVVQALTQTTVSAEIAARIKHMPWREGDTFKQDDTLVEFDCDIFQAQRDKVDAEVRAAQAKWDNDVLLASTRSIGALEVKLSEVAVQRAQAEWRMAKINTDRCTIKAPWAGRVVGRKAQELEVAKLHQEILSIVSTESLEVMAVVPAQWIRFLRLGQTLEVRIDETGTRHTAQVVALGSQVDAVSQTLNIRASLTDGARLLPGMSGDALLK